MGEKENGGEDKTKEHAPVAGFPPLPWVCSRSLLGKILFDKTRTISWPRLPKLLVLWYGAVKRGA